MIYPRLSTGSGILVFFTNLSLMVFQVRYLASFLLFSVIDQFGWFWVESLDTNIQLKLVEFLKSPLLVLHFSYYILITFLMMLCRITKYCDDTTLLSGICSVATTRISL